MVRFLSVFGYFTFLAVSSIILFGPALNGMNDDSIIVWLTSGYAGTAPTAITVYTSFFYGIILKTLYSINQNIGWHGIVQLLLVLIGSAALASIALKKTDPKQRKLFYFLLLNLSIFVIWFSPRPTFTVTSIFIGFIAFGILILSLKARFDKNILLVAIFLLIFSYILRPEAAYLAISFGILNVFLFLYFNKYFLKTHLLKIGIFLLPIVILTISDSIITSVIKSQSPAWARYLEFNDLNYELDTNPAELVFFEKLTSGALDEVDWTSVEAVLYQKNAFFDNKVFSNEVLTVATESAAQSMGISGVLNSSFSLTLDRAWMYLSESTGFLIFFFLVIILFLIAELKPKVKWSYLLTNLSLLALVTYYFSAVSRLPARIHVPLIFGVSLLLLIIILEANFIKKQLANLIYLMASTTLIISLIYGMNGMREISKLNKGNRINIEQAIIKMNKLDENGKFIGLLEAFSLEAMLAYGSPQISEDVNYLTSGWMTFSPPWNEKRNNMQLLKNNPYEAIAKQPGVYWVSDPVTAEVLNMYMNDREIFRKNKCEILKLHKDLRVYTYQSDKVCEN